MKRCFKCKKIKPLTEFYKHSEMKDGHLNKCKECNKKDVQKNYKKNKKHYQEYEKNRNTPERQLARKLHSRKLRKEKPEKVYEYQNRYIKKFPEKYKSKNILSNAIRDNKIKKEPCKICGEKKVHGHHKNYKKPLDIIWLCQKHHVEIHLNKIGGK